MIASKNYQPSIVVLKPKHFDLVYLRNLQTRVDYIIISNVAEIPSTILQFSPGLYHLDDSGKSITRFSDSGYLIANDLV